ncbi:MAG TPA: NAD(P)(+) transhydrogenase (Re/Si-specific) subunit beta [Acidimicrobiia bacterium]|nr:NAD(P)(+) transhydrogenase (Re/Si-specific) subunit beta [Acidimicrobiia bacterium]
MERLTVLVVDSELVEELAAAQDRDGRDDCQPSDPVPHQAPCRSGRSQGRGQHPAGAEDPERPEESEDTQERQNQERGIPILNVNRAGTVIVVKRSLSPGFAGIDNPLFYDDKTLMFFADAKEALETTVSALESI